jgi:hypothetical protein
MQYQENQFCVIDTLGVSTGLGCSEDAHSNPSELYGRQVKELFSEKFRHRNQLNRKVRKEFTQSSPRKALRP